MKTLQQHITEKLVVNKDYKTSNDYKMPRGNITKLDNIVNDAFKHDLANETCLLKTYKNTSYKEKINDFKHTLELYLGNIDLRNDNYKRKKAILNLTKYIVNDLFENKCSIYVFWQNETVKKIYDELGDKNYFDLFEEYVIKESESTYKYYIGSDVAFMTYDRGTDYTDFDVFILKNY